jgi:hypothetical protein
MLASAVHYNKSAVGSVSVLSALLRHLNTGTLALAPFVALALLTGARGKEPEARVSTHARDTESQLTIAPCDTWVPAQQEVQRDKFTAKDFWNKGAPNR